MTLTRRTIVMFAASGFVTAVIRSRLSQAAEPSLEVTRSPSADAVPLGSNHVRRAVSLSVKRFWRISLR